MLMLVLTAGASDRIESDFASALPLANSDCGVALDCYHEPNIAEICPTNADFPYPEEPCFQDFTSDSSLQAESDMSSLLGLEMPTRSTTPGTSEAQIGDHLSNPHSEAGITLKTPVDGSVPRPELEDMDAMSSFPFKDAAIPGVSLPGTKRISSSEHSFLTNPTRDFDNTKAVLPRPKAGIEGNDGSWTPGNFTSFSLDFTNSVDLQTSSIGTLTLNPNQKDGIADGLYIGEDTGRGLDPNQQNITSQHSKGFTPASPLKADRQTLARPAQVIPETIPRTDTLTSLFQSDHSDNSWNLFEALADADFWQTAKGAAARTQFIPMKITDRDYPGHIEYPHIKALGPLSDIPELSRWYASSTDRRRQMLGLPGKTNPIDEIVSALMAAFDSAKENLSKLENQNIVLEAEVQTALNALLSSQSELEAFRTAIETRTHQGAIHLCCTVTCGDKIACGCGYEVFPTKVFRSENASCHGLSEDRDCVNPAFLTQHKSHRLGSQQTALQW